MHLEFCESDGSKLNLDVDVCPPSFGVSNDRPKDFNGSNKKKRRWLEEHRPVMWRTEWRKTENMRDAARADDGLLRPVRLRFANGRDVWVEQVSRYIRPRVL